MIRRFDNYLLDRSQVACHAIQRFSGVTNFAIARAFALAYAVLTIMRYPDLWWLVPPSVGWVFLMGWLYEIECKNNDDIGLLNPAREYFIFYWIRILNLLFLCVFLVEGQWSAILRCSMSLLMCITAVLTPLPPGQSKLSKWANDIAASLRKPVPVGTR